MRETTNEDSSVTGVIMDTIPDKIQKPDDYDSTKYCLEDMIIKNIKVGILVLPIHGDVPINDSPSPKCMWVNVRDVGYELVLVYLTTEKECQQGNLCVKQRRI